MAICKDIKFLMREGTLIHYLTNHRSKLFDWHIDKPNHLFSIIQFVYLSKAFQLVFIQEKHFPPSWMKAQLLKYNFNGSTTGALFLDWKYFKYWNIFASHNKFHTILGWTTSTSQRIYLTTFCWLFNALLYTWSMVTAFVLFLTKRAASQIFVL